MSLHITVSWDIKTSDTARWNLINEALKAELAPYAWIKPLTTLYVVTLPTSEERNALTNRLVTVAKNYTETIHFLITPVMVGGRYTGYLPKNLWEKLNERTQ